MDALNPKLKCKILRQVENKLRNACRNSFGIEIVATSGNFHGMQKLWIKAHSLCYVKLSHAFVENSRKYLRITNANRLHL